MILFIKFINIFCGVSQLFKFNPGSGWSVEMELECFLIFKKLEQAGFPRGMQTELCNELAGRSILSSTTIKAKVGNFKSESGVTNKSNASQATKEIVIQFGHMSVSEVDALLQGYKLCKEEHTSKKL